MQHGSVAQPERVRELLLQLQSLTTLVFRFGFFLTDLTYGIIWLVNILQYVPTLKHVELGQIEYITECGDVFATSTTLPVLAHFPTHWLDAYIWMKPLHRRLLICCVYYWRA